MEKLVNGVTLKIIKGDIATQNDVQAVVNAANRELRPGGGVAGAIHRAAGPKLETECRQYTPISPGEAVLTKAYNLPNDHVIHCLGPVYQVDKPHEKLLADCYNNTLQIAEDNAIVSVAFPAISTGVFGYPKGEAVKIALQSVFDKMAELKHVKLIKFVLFDDETVNLYQEELAKKV